MVFALGQGFFDIFLRHSVKKLAEFIHLKDNFRNFVLDEYNIAIIACNRIMTNLFSLEGKNAWITGAAYGIGFSIAKAFVAAGAKTIVFNVRYEDALQKALEAYKEAGISNVKGYICDVTDEDAVKALVDKIHAEVGGIDILVNNAGIIKRIPMHEMKRSEFQQVIDIDLVGPYICASAVLPEMMKRREGKIINVCSMMITC